MKQFIDQCVYCHHMRKYVAVETCLACPSFKEMSFGMVDCGYGEETNRCTVNG
jgi:hypothetical protein